jgi:outer membrane protein insertion porin family
MQFIFYALLLCNIVDYVPVYGAQEITINLAQPLTDACSTLARIWEKPVLLEKLICKADTLISEQELRDLGKLYDNTYITGKNLEQLCRFVYKKNKFNELKIIHKMGKKGIALDLALSSVWTFKKLELKTELLDKDKYRHVYMIKPGDIFAQEKHQPALHKLHEELRHAGYLNHCIKDTIIRDEQTKEITVNLDIEPGKKFVINTVQIHVTLEDGTIAASVQKMLEPLATDFINYYFEQDVLQDLEQEIKQELITAGYINFDVELIPDIKLDAGTVALTGNVILCEKKRCVFTGNTFFTTEQLINELFDAQISTAIPPTLLVDDIRELYKNKGFLKVIVTLTETADQFNFTIKEGPRYKITDILLRGELVLDNNLLKQELFKPVLEHVYYDERKVQEAFEKLEVEYIKQGFWDVKITKQDINFIEPDHVTLAFMITPGRRRLLHGVQVNLFPEIMNEPMFEPYKNLKKAIPFDMQLVHEQHMWLVKFLQKKGYLYSVVKPELQESPDGVTVVWNIDLGLGMVRFGKTIIQGSNRIQPHVVLRELAYQEGDIFDPQKIAESVKQLKSLGIFETLTIGPYTSDQEEIKTMVLNFTQDYPFELCTRIGYQQVSRSFTHQSGSTYRFGTSFLVKNPAGLADKLRFDADVTRFTRDLSITYELPWIFNQPIRTCFKLFSTQFDQPLFTGSHNNIYKVYNNGLYAQFNRCFGAHTGMCSIGSEVKKITGLSEALARIIDFKADLINRSIWYVFSEPIVTFSSIDNKSEPVSGNSILASLKLAVAPKIPEASYVKIFGEYCGFRPLFKNTVIGAFRIAVGHIFSSGLNTIMPTDRFYLGGATTMRSYEPDMVPPLNAFALDNQVYWVPIGGKTMVNINGEVRFPIYDKLSGVVFTDIGALSHTRLSEIYGENIYGATGFGIRYGTPIGPVRFDIGWKWKKRIPEDRSYAWFLTFGHAF